MIVHDDSDDCNGESKGNNDGGVHDINGDEYIYDISIMVMTNMPMDDRVVVISADNDDGGDTNGNDNYDCDDNAGDVDVILYISYLM